MAPPTVCPECGSGLLQPLRWEAVEDSEVVVELRCPDCEIRTQGVYTQRDVADLDKLHGEWRRTLVEFHERCVAENMRELIRTFGMALERDLLGADDFAPLPRRRRAAA